MRSLLDQHGDAAMALGVITRSFQPTAVVISIDATGNLILEQKLQPGVPFDAGNPAHRLASFIVNHAQEVLGRAFDVAPEHTEAPRIMRVN